MSQLPTGPPNGRAAGLVPAPLPGWHAHVLQVAPPPSHALIYTAAHPQVAVLQQQQMYFRQQHLMQLQSTSGSGLLPTPSIMPPAQPGGGCDGLLPVPTAGAPLVPTSLPGAWSGAPVALGVTPPLPVVFIVHSVAAHTRFGPPLNSSPTQAEEDPCWRSFRGTDQACFLRQ
jgi:hypothetical protein